MQPIMQPVSCEMSKALTELFGEHFLEEVNVIGSIAVECASQNKIDLYDSIDAAIEIYYDLKQNFEKFS